MAASELDDEEFARLLEAYAGFVQTRSENEFWQTHDCAPELQNRLKSAGTALQRVELLFSSSTNREADQTNASLGALKSIYDFPKEVDRFQIVRELGRGGFGIVYLALDPSLQRQVAIKIPRIETWNSKAHYKRFAKEAEIAAGLDHPHIVTVYEVGRALDGIYIVSMYCPGANLSEWLLAKSEALKIGQVVELMICLCEAMAYCHERGVLHRDLKPANVLLFPTPHGSLPFTPKLNDFGLATIPEATLANTTKSALLGTPLYMSPEQASSRYDDICPATDVYALGAILYELLAGAPPFANPNLADLLDQIRAKQPDGLRVRRKDIPKDLETICLKCLSKLPSDRYHTAKQLLDDLRAFADEKAILARRPGATDKIAHWCSLKERIGESGMVVIAVNAAAIGVLFIAMWMAFRRQLPIPLGLSHASVTSGLAIAAFIPLSLILVGRSIQQKRMWGAVTGYFSGLLVLAAGLLFPLGMFGASNLLGSEAPGLQALSGAVCLIGLVQSIACAIGWYAIGKLDRQKPSRFLASAALSRLVALPCLAAAGLLCLAYLSAPKLADHSQAADLGGISVNNDARTVQAFQTQFADDLRKAHSLVFLGKRQAAEGILENLSLDAQGDSFPLAYLRRRLRNIDRRFEGLTGQILCADISPDMRWVAGGDRAGTVCIWDAATGNLLKSFNESKREVCAIEFSPNSKLLAITGQDSMVHLLSCDDWKESMTFREDGGTNTGLAWSPDGSMIATSNRGKAVTIWDTFQGGRLKSFSSLQDVARDVDWSKNGKLLAANVGNSVVIWNTKTWRELKTPPIDESPLYSLAFSPDSGTLLTAGQTRTLKLMDCQKLKLSAEVDANGHLQSVGWSPDGSLVAAGMTSGGPRIWKSEKLLSEVMTLEESDNAIRTAKFSHDGKRLLSASEQGNLVTLWDVDASLGYYAFLPSDRLLAFQSTLADTVYLTSGESTHLVDSKGAVLFEVDKQSDCGALTTDQGKIALNMKDGIEIIDVRSRSLIRRLPRPAFEIAEMVFSPDGNYLIAISGASQWSLCRVSDGNWIAGGLKNNTSYSAPTFDANSQFFVVRASSDRGVAVRSCVDGSLVDHLPMASLPINCLAADPLLNNIYLANTDGVLIWDRQAKQLRTNAFNSKRGILRMAVSPDARTLAVSVRGEGLFLLDTQTGAELFPILKTAGYIDQLQFTHDRTLQCRRNLEGNISAIVFRTNL